MIVSEYLRTENILVITVDLESRIQNILNVRATEILYKSNYNSAKTEAL